MVEMLNSFMREMKDFWVFLKVVGIVSCYTGFVVILLFCLLSAWKDKAIGKIQ